MLIFSISFPHLVNFLALWIPPERRVWDEGRPKNRVEFTNNSSIYTYTPQITFTQGHVSVFDKYLY